MEVTGKIILALPPQSGESKNGNPWKKREYVLETEEQYPRKIHFDFFGDRADQFPLSEGQRVKLSFDIESREFNNRWYTNIRGWKAEIIGENSETPAKSDNPFGNDIPMPNDPFDSVQDSGSNSGTTDDLPF